MEEREAIAPLMILAGLSARSVEGGNIYGNGYVAGLKRNKKTGIRTIE